MSINPLSLRSAKAQARELRAAIAAKGVTRIGIWDAPLDAAWWPQLAKWHGTA